MNKDPNLNPTLEFRLQVLEPFSAITSDFLMLYEKDGAVWFRSTKYTDDQDRVIKKNDGTNTYLTADIAYHYDKFERGFDRLIDIWGADHHGYIPRMKASIAALGHDWNPTVITFAADGKTATATRVCRRDGCCGGW